MSHDRSFKQLFSAFFLDFVDLFLPDVADVLDRSVAPVPLDKEVFTDIGLGESREVDLLMRARLKDTDGFFLVHIENQARAQPEFAKRMFRYFARLTEKYDLPVYPVAVFSYDAPARLEPEHYTVTFSQKRVLSTRSEIVYI